MIAQIGVADAVCIVALPLVIDPSHAARAALGSAVVLAAVGVVALILRYLEPTAHGVGCIRLSEHRRFALELRINLILLFGLAALAQWSHVSVLLAGFGWVWRWRHRTAATARPAAVRDHRGLLRTVVLRLVGRLARSARPCRPSVPDRARGRPRGGAVAAHLVTRLAGSPVSLALLASAQLGVPVAAATLGTQLGLLAPAEPAALIVGALVTVAACALGGDLAVRAGLLAPPKPNTMHRARIRQPALGLFTRCLRVSNRTQPGGGTTEIVTSGNIQLPVESWRRPGILAGRRGARGRAAAGVPQGRADPPVTAHRSRKKARAAYLSSAVPGRNRSANGGADDVPGCVEPSCDEPVCGWSSSRAMTGRARPALGPRPPGGRARPRRAAPASSAGSRAGCSA